MNKLVVRNIEDARVLIYGEEQNFIARADKSEDVNFQKEAGYALQALEKNDYLVTVAQKNPISLKNAVSNVAAIGLTLNPAQKLAYLTPIDGRIELFVSYMGYINLATRSGSISHANVGLVYENDDFQMMGISEEPIHKRDPFSVERGKIVGGYCCVKLPSGDYMTTTMTIKEFDKIQMISKAKNGPWKSWPDEMRKKTVIKRASKLWPSAKDNRLAEAINMSNQYEGIDFEEKEKEREAQLLKKRETSRIENDRKKELLTEITFKSSELTKGLNLNEKGAFMVGRLKVNSFNDLVRKKVQELEEILANLNK